MHIQSKAHTQKKSLNKIKKTPSLQKIYIKQKVKTTNKLYKKNQSLYNELLKIHAYYGDTSLRTHYTQDSFLFAYRNEYALYDLHTTVFTLKKALHFLKKQNLSSLIFAGSPLSVSENCVEFFHKRNICFFPSNEWFPGYISRKAYSHTKVLIIYDISNNLNAKAEAFHAKFPIIGFFTIFGDLCGIDYPVSLNLENNDIWYYNLWKTFFY